MIQTLKPNHFGTILPSQKPQNEQKTNRIGGMCFGIRPENVVFMEAIRINNFLNSEQDWELKQYTILSLIQSYKKSFNQSKLYPALASLMHLSAILKNIIKKDEAIKLWLPKVIKTSGIKNENVIVEYSQSPSSGINDLPDLVNWALPIIDSVLSEGMVIYNFVYESMSLSQLNSAKSLRDSGYIIVPDNKNNTLNLLKYELVIFNSYRKPEKSVRTTLIGSFNKDSEESLTKLKCLLKSNHKSEKDNPVFYVETAIDFPFAETILPIAKRKLLNTVSITQ